MCFAQALISNLVFFIRTGEKLCASDLVKNTEDKCAFCRVSINTEFFLRTSNDYLKNMVAIFAVW